ncbi:MAG: hypothetical protein NC300_08005 [Bacteroidales bacterium]|nr:hypothetical protein [Clostridium sp.]MCM1204073.1 hypothetical protein [Bacteroidales bacterium]
MKQLLLKLGMYGRGYIAAFFLWVLFSAYPVNGVSAQQRGDLEKIIVVKNENQMLRGIINGMRRHQTDFIYSYPGIEKDFAGYRKKGKGYSAFLEKLSLKDGYLAGGISGVSVMVCGGEKPYVSIQFGYITTKKQEHYINQKVRRIARKLGGGSRAVRAKRAHDYLIKHMRYDERGYTPYSAFKKGKGSCMAYALAYQRILQEMKIPCVYVVGQGHAWNMVKLGGAWYNVDVTWDDTGNSYRYFLKADSDFPGHGKPVSKRISSLPKAPCSYPLYRIGE